MFTYSETEASVCINCDGGKFSGSVGAGGCQECPAGTFNGNAGVSLGSPCPVGTKENGATREAFCLEPTGIVIVTKETLEVQMKVEQPCTKDYFDADAQNKFLLTVANSVKTSVDNLYIDCGSPSLPGLSLMSLNTRQTGYS